LRRTAKGSVGLPTTTMLWVVLCSFFLGAVAALGVAVYVGLLVFGRIEKDQIQTQQAAQERSREYGEAVERGDVPFEPPPLDAQINAEHADLIRQVASYAPNILTARPPSLPPSSTTAPLAGSVAPAPSLSSSLEDPSSQPHQNEETSGEKERENGDAEAVLVSGWVNLQMAGKRKIRKSCYAFVRDTDLYYGSREGDTLDAYEVIGLDGCLARTIDDEKSKLLHAVEVSHNNRKVADKSDCIYIITQSETMQLRWYRALLKICEPYEVEDKPKSKTGLEAAASLLSGKDRMSRALQELRGYKPTVTNDGVHGWVRIQREEDPKQIQKRFATVTSSVFATFNTEKVFAASEKWEVDLRGCNVELVQRPKNAIKISRKASELTTGLDHIYVIADSADYAVAWHAALSAGTRQTTAGNADNLGSVSPRGLPTSPSVSMLATSSSDPPSPIAVRSAESTLAPSGGGAAVAPENSSGGGEDISEFLKIESAQWFNALTSRFWYNFRNSEDLVVLIKNFLETKMKDKLAQKKLDGFLERIDVVELSLGDVVPSMSGFKVLPQRRSGELGIDLVLDYKGEDRPAFVKFAGNVWITQKTCIPFVVTATLHSLSGKMHLHCAPWPAERFSLSFYSVPAMDIRLESVVGDKRQIHNFPKLNDLILNKLTNILIEKTVMPNRRYVTIPRTKKRNTSQETPTAATENKLEQQMKLPIEDRRKAVVQSVLHSELSFIGILQPLLKLYTEDMFLELTELHGLFGRIMVIYNYHCKIVKELEAKLATWNDVASFQRTIAPIFLQLTEFAEIEMEFSSKMKAYASVIARLRQSNRRFGVFLQERELRGEDSLCEILSKAALRSFFYLALLQELQGCTDSDHPDCKPLERMISMLLPLVNSAAHRDEAGGSEGAYSRPKSAQPPVAVKSLPQPAAAPRSLKPLPSPPVTPQPPGQTASLPPPLPPKPLLSPPTAPDAETPCPASSPAPFSSGAAPAVPPRPVSLQMADSG